MQSADFTAEKAQRCRRAIAQLLSMANTDIAGEGNLIQCYTECSTGRLFIQGPSYQSVPRAVRAAGLDGYYDYDFRSCHYTLLEQIAAQLVVDCPHITRYNRHPRPTQRRIARACGPGVSREQVKRICHAVLYGALASRSPRNAIMEILKERAAAEQLFANRTFRNILHDVQIVRTAVVERWPLWRGDQLVNDVGCSISVARNPRRKLAHILQGAEQAMLRVVAGELGKEMTTLLHDGWVMARKLSAQEIEHLERRVNEVTGYRVKIVRKQLRSPVSQAGLSGQNACVERGQLDQALRRPETVAAAT